MGREEKNWRSDGRQFAQIVGNTNQSPLQLDFLQATQVESSKPHVMFHIPEGSFRLDTTLFSQGYALLRKQILPGLSAVFPELETDLYASIALGLSTLRL